MSACRICATRRAKRYCPGVSGDICPLCCGREREVSVNCPVGCPYLREAHEHERLPALDPATLPHRDINVDEGFLQRVEPVFVVLAASVAQAAAAPGVLDLDLRDALASLTQTWRSAESGLLYDPGPENRVAADVCRSVQERIAALQERAREHSVNVPASDILRILVFLQRLEMQHNNGRPKSKAYVEFLLRMFPPGAVEQKNEPPAGSGLILTP